MLFTCTPANLAIHIFASLALVESLPLQKLWDLASDKCANDQLDDFQKSIVWKSLAAGPASRLFVAQFNGAPIQSAQSLSLSQLLEVGPEREISISPTEECQSIYLTNTTNYQAIKSSLGELPFQLLVTIARHGADGILNPDLTRESGQDARSISIRLQKLQTAGLILCRSIYTQKMHTTLSVHYRFAKQLNLAKSSTEKDGDLDASRDIDKLKRKIVSSLESAPNQLRGFSDLRKELNLAQSASAAKFFRSVCLNLHKAGYIEKLQVELPQTKQRVYAIKFVKSLPKVLTEDDVLDFNAVKDGFDDSDVEDEDLNSPQNPSLNLIFPLFLQMFKHVHERGPGGITFGEINKHLTGCSEYKPFTKISEQIPTYLSNSVTLKPFKKYKEPYDECSISKLYDNEGKLKFYKYFATVCYDAKKPPIPKYPFTTKVPKWSLEQWNKHLQVSIGKISNAVLTERQKRVITGNAQISGSSEKRQKIDQSLKDISNDPIKIEVLEKPTPRKLRNNKVRPEVVDNSPSDEDYEPEAASEDQKQNVIIARDALRRKESGNTTILRAEPSLRSTIRRNHLIQIIEERGGYMFKGVELCKLLDGRLGNTTSTDGKTLHRDVGYLVKSDRLCTKVIQLRDSSTTTKTLLYLPSFESQLDQAKLENLQDEYLESISKKNIKMVERRVIQSEIQLFVEQPRVTVTKRALNRLNRVDNVDSGERGTEIVVPAIQTTKVKREVDDDIFSLIKSSRRARKVTLAPSTDSTASSAKKSRRNIKLEKPDIRLLYRSVVISKAISKEAIDFDAIAELFNDLDGLVVRQKWGTIRRLMGGAEAINKSVETFKNMVMQGIDDGSITADDLSTGDLSFFLDYWKKIDVTTEFNVVDESPLFSTYEQNASYYLFETTAIPQSAGLSERIEDISMRQKEHILSQAMFSSKPNPHPVRKANDELRSVLKAIFGSLESGEVSPQTIKSILSRFGEPAVREATDALLNDREIMYVTTDNESAEFMLTDRFKNSFISRGFSESSFHQAMKFKNLLGDVFFSGKGLILSQGIFPGDMAILLELISNGDVELIRIDRTIKFDSYESRLIDKAQIACDIVVRDSKATSLDKYVSSTIVPVPVQAACQPIWVDTEAQIMTTWWKRIIVAVVFYVVTRPGIPDGLLYQRMNAVLSVSDFEKLMNWLDVNDYVKPTKFDGYVATSKWQSILGN